MSRRTASDTHPPPLTVGSTWSWLLARVAAIPIEWTWVSRRGFKVPRQDMVERLEDIGACFVNGYMLALRSASLADLDATLQHCHGADAGFVFEGAAMGVAMVDALTPGRRWFEPFVQGPARAHEYMAWIGLGWALARLPVSPLRALARYSSINKWLALDGWGFHEGYFNWPRSVMRHRRPSSLAGDAACVFDQGLGRSLWFVCGAEIDAVAGAVAGFESGRRADLWAGVGLAAAYAGGLPAKDLLLLKALSGDSAAALAQGVVFAAQARRRAGTPAAHCELACRQLLGLDAQAGAEIAIVNLPQGGDLAAYQRWRQNVQRSLRVLPVTRPRQEEA